MRQLLTESVLLASLGAALGWLLARWGTGLVNASIPPPPLMEIVGIAGDGRYGNLYEDLQPYPVTFLGAATLFPSVASLAWWIPARLAGKVDPLAALRYE